MTGGIKGRKGREGGREGERSVMGRKVDRGRKRNIR